LLTEVDPENASQAVVTKGGRIVWLAGQVGAADASGKSLAEDFDGRVREVFSRLGQTLEQAAGTWLIWSR
jgi:2-iminobutanoate/2-iminopropanoate deaminase